MASTPGSPSSATSSFAEDDLSDIVLQVVPETESDGRRDRKDLRSSSGSSKKLHVSHLVLSMPALYLQPARMQVGKRL